MTNLPTLVDADTGFGEPMNVARTVQLLEELGLAGCHIEDQVNPKRCGHLDRKDDRRRRRDAPANRRGGLGAARPVLRHVRPDRRPRESRA